jgi:nitrate/nitrite transport system substrate-binding protein
MFKREGLMSEERRQFIKGSAALAAGPAVATGAWAQGSDAPEKKEVRIGFIPLTDCASVVMAAVNKFDEKYGVKIIPTKEASWAGVRDKLVNGELDMAHVLYGLVYGVHLGIAGPKKDMAVLMNLNHNGQALTLSKKLADKGAVDVASLARVMATDKRDYTFAQTFPTGTHAMWLYYWLASGGINPMKDAKVITVPPPQMVANMRVGNMDGFCVGEPWNHRAIIDGIGITAATTQDVWKDHPEKVLGTTGDFVKTYPNTARAVTIAAVLEAGRWIDAGLQNKNRMAETIAAKSLRQHQRRCDQPAHPGPLPERPGQDLGRPQPHEVLQRRRRELPLPERRHVVPDPVQALGPAEETTPTTWAVARQINQTGLYKQGAAAQLKVSVPRERLPQQQADRRRGLGRQASRRSTPTASRSPRSRPEGEGPHHGQCRLSLTARGSQPQAVARGTAAQRSVRSRCSGACHAGRRTAAACSPRPHRLEAAWPAPGCRLLAGLALLIGIWALAHAERRQPSQRPRPPSMPP